MSPDKKHVETTAVATDVVTKHIDQAALFLADAEDFEPLTAKQEQRLKRKIDFILIPMVSHFTSEVALAYRLSSSLPLRLVLLTRSLFLRQLYMVFAKTTTSLASSIHGLDLFSLLVPLLACFPHRPSSTSFQPLSTYVAALSAGQLWLFLCRRAAALVALWHFGS
jgi:hypothetical protein